MKTDDILIDPLILEDCLEYLHEKTIEQEQTIVESEQIFYSYIGLHQNVVEMIFLIANEFALDAEVKYLAIHLYDKYMNYKTWEVFKLSEKSENPNKTWEIEQENMNSEVKLRLLSCIQLASKMNSNTNFLNILDVQDALFINDTEREYTKEIILQSEFHVFEVVGFKMPQCTPKVCIDILLAITGLGSIPEILEASYRLLDLSYICHEELYSYAKLIVEQHISKALVDQRSRMMMESNAFFLGAAIIICSVLCVNVKGTNLKKTEILKRVANLVKIEDIIIWDMANLLFSLSFQKFL